MFHKQRPLFVYFPHMLNKHVLLLKKYTHLFVKYTHLFVLFPHLLNKIPHLLIKQRALRDKHSLLQNKQKAMLNKHEALRVKQRRMFDCFCPAFCLQKAMLMQPHPLYWKAVKTQYRFPSKHSLLLFMLSQFMPCSFKPKKEELKPRATFRQLLVYSFCCLVISFLKTYVQAMQFFLFRFLGELRIVQRLYRKG